MSDVQTVPADVKSKNSLARQFIAVALASAITATPMLAQAAELDFSGVTGELEGVKTAVLAVIGGLLTIWAIVLGWRTFRRSAG